MASLFSRIIAGEIPSYKVAENESAFVAARFWAASPAFSPLSWIVFADYEWDVVDFDWFTVMVAVIDDDGFHLFFYFQMVLIVLFIAVVVVGSDGVDGHQGIGPHFPRQYQTDFGIVFVIV